MPHWQSDFFDNQPPSRKYETQQRVSKSREREVKSGSQSPVLQIRNSPPRALNLGTLKQRQARILTILQFADSTTRRSMKLGIVDQFFPKV